MKRLSKIIQILLLVAGIALIGCDKGTSASSSEVSSGQSQDQSITVHITKTGKKYHMAGCRYLKDSDIPIDLATAKAEGYTACSVCNPPQ
jgi:micrococcal nuclease